MITDWREPRFRSEDRELTHEEWDVIEEEGVEALENPDAYVLRKPPTQARVSGEQSVAREMQRVLPRYVLAQQALQGKEYMMLHTRAMAYAETIANCLPTAWDTPLLRGIVHEPQRHIDLRRAAEVVHLETPTDREGLLTVMREYHDALERNV